MDVLSQFFQVINLRSAVFFHAHCTAPWRVESPEAMTSALTALPHFDRLLFYHFLVEGKCSVRFDDGHTVNLSAGEVILIPHGHKHSMGWPDNNSSVTPYSIEVALQERQPVLTLGKGEGEVSRFICGFMACDSLLLRPVLDALPRSISVNLHSPQGPHWLEQSIAIAVEEAASPKPGGEGVLTKLSELIFVETLRKYINDMPSDQRGWLGGLRDRVVSRCLALMHEQPAHPWTVDMLASAIGVARSALAERFSYFVGQPPMQYLARWRMGLAANHLSRTSLSLTRIAEQVGYQSEHAFNRAFKRAYGVPPGYWRRSRSAAFNSESFRLPESYLSVD